MEFIKAFAMFLSLAMCIFLFVYSYMEAIRICNEEGKVQATTFLFSLVSACIFGFTTHSLYFS